MLKPLCSLGMLPALLGALCLSHPGVRGQPGRNLADATTKAATLRQIDSLLEEKYVLPDKATDCARAFRKRWRAGAYDSLVSAEEFAGHITADLRSITQDSHFLFRVVESSDIGEKPESPLHHPIRYHRMGVRENAGFTKLEWLEGNVGYLSLVRFNYFPDVQRMVVAAMTLLSRADAIVVDLRDNGGGSGDYLSSYFLNHPTQLTGWYSREDGVLTEFWTTREIGVERLTAVPLFILISRRTFSAAESFAYDMKVRRRATLVGEPTKGGAHSVDLYRVGDQFEIYIPTTRAVNPVTGGNWEGTGVLPDIVVPSAAAFDTALALARKAGREYGKSKETRLKRAVEEMQTVMNHAVEQYRAGNPEEGQSALDSVFTIASRNGLVTQFFTGVLAYNFSAPEDEEIQYAVLRKNIEYFPDSPSAYETLAHAYAVHKRNKPAIENFRKVLLLDPDNRSAARMIAELQKK